MGFFGFTYRCSGLSIRTPEPPIAGRLSRYGGLLRSGWWSGHGLLSGPLSGPSSAAAGRRRRCRRHGSGVHLDADGGQHWPPMHRG